MESTLKHNKIPVNIEDEMRQSYMDYAMSVIIRRALPDARDGLKPVHRRILYAMYDLGNEWNKGYKKSARVVGDVIGKYHPHGDSAVYDAVVRMAQDFSMRYPLIDGQGNFGSVDGDPAAAMRYTEIRMARIAGELLADIDKETVEFSPNYDETLQEPRVLPARLPNLLLNGSSGIAVGMTTNIPPHNLNEVADAVVALIENPAITVEGLMAYVPGPDFPTAGFIHGTAAIREAYETGKGVLQVRARATTEVDKKSGRSSIIVTEIPYQVNKARLLERIAELVNEKRVEGIYDLRDESDRQGMRIVVELKREAVPEIVLNQLYKMTPMQESFGMIMLAIVENRPRLLSLKEALQQFVSHRFEVVTRRTVFDLRKAEERLHILEGLKIAIENLDAVIQLIRRAPNPPAAKEGLVATFVLSEVQAQAVLDMRLQRLTNLERDKILEEHREVESLIARLRAILADEREISKIIVEEMHEVKSMYGDARRTEIVEHVGDISIEDMIADEDMAVTISHEGYIKRNPVSLYRAQRRGGKGKIGTTTRDEDFVEHLFIASTHSYILFFTTAGKVYWIKVHEVPQAGRAARGKPVVNLLELKSDEKISAFLPVREFRENHFVFFATKQGVVKKTDLMAYANPRPSGIIAIGLDTDDEVISVRMTDGKQEVILTTRNGQAIRFREEEVRSMGRGATGVRGITLGNMDEVVSLEILSPGVSVLTVAENGYGKRTDIAEYRVQARGGKGIITMKATERTGAVIGVQQVTDDDNVMLVTSAGKIIRLRVADIRVIGRNTQGVRLIDIEEGERVVSLARLAEQEDSEQEDNGESSEE
ncbi:MAG: DNA gyrase subunit A [Polyangiaceae bacterium UTPRO1]|nr:DNA gyrase subunit A [Myxococcales bacterium]OQY67651.1 MAG: DNA gyrase subunit A [Polyangiaceae bacterium UTPRO1]